MDDFNLDSLHESRNEWVSRLINILTPNVFTGIKNIFDESVKLASQQTQPEKYLMTFQNLLVQIPKWNNEIISNEVKRIQNSSACTYIEDLITCVHIIQLKALTCVRVGLNEKNVNINIPKLNDYIHRVYINTARVIYSNIYLFEQDILPLQIQQNYTKVNKIIKEAIIESIRESMPIDEILRAYLEDSITEQTTPTSVQNAQETPAISETTPENISNITNIIEEHDIQLEPTNNLENDISITPDENLFKSDVDDLEAQAPSLFKQPEESTDNDNISVNPNLDQKVTFDKSLEPGIESLEEVDLFSHLTNEATNIVDDSLIDENLDELLGVETIV